MMESVLFFKGSSVKTTKGGSLPSSNIDSLAGCMLPQIL
jgi:hypothetical protein